MLKGQKSLKLRLENMKVILSNLGYNIRMYVYIYII